LCLLHGPDGCVALHPGKDRQQDGNDQCGQHCPRGQALAAQGILPAGKDELLVQRRGVGGLLGVGLPQPCFCFLKIPAAQQERAVALLSIPLQRPDLQPGMGARPVQVSLYSGNELLEGCLKWLRVGGIVAGEENPI